MKTTERIRRGIEAPPGIHIPEIHNSLTRRDFLVGGAAALLLAGCGGGNPSGSTEASGDTRTIEHQFGSTEVSGRPERIVTVGLNDQDAVYALGRKPVAATTWFTDTLVYPWAEEASGEIVPEALPSSGNIEAVAAQNPDLILATFSSVNEERYDLLSEIAPTIAGAPGFADYETPWQVQTTMIGRALGQEREAERLVAEAERKFAEAAERHPRWADATAVLASQYVGGTLLVYPEDTPATYFLEALGFAYAPGIDELPMNDTYFAPALSVERLDLIDVDLVVFDTPPEVLESSGFFDLATYQNLDAVKEGRVIFPPENIRNALSFRTVLSLPWALERLEPRIEAAMDGDPETEVTE